MAAAKKSAAKKSAKPAGKRGRPKQTDEQKAANKAAKEAAAPPKDAPAPKPEKKAAAAAKPERNDADEQKLFLQHLPIIQAQVAKAATAVSDLRNLYKKAKGDGFDKYDFEIAMALDTAEKEAKQKAKIARTLQIARFCGKSLGGQLEMFLEPDRTPASENAYEEGRIASMKNETARPGYDPSTEQHREYMRGYHEVQGEKIKTGIKPLDDTPKGSRPADEAPKPTPVSKVAEAPKSAPAPADVAAPAAQEPTSGLRVTRADFLRHEELRRQREAAEDQERRDKAAQIIAARQAEENAAKAAAAARATNGARPAAPPPQAEVEEEEESSMFKRKSPATAA